MLLAKKHKASREVRAQLEQLLTAWRQLLQESNNRGRGLEEAQDILEFNNQAEKVEAWIRDKVCVWLIFSDVFCSLKNIKRPV
jgi:spectrin beta